MMKAVQLRVLGGALARVPNDATAFAHRDRGLFVNIAAMYMDPGEKDTHDAWVAGLADSLGKGEAGGYVGFLGEEDEGTVRAAYPGPTWDRLRELKRRYDPDNLFRLNHKHPAGGRSAFMADPEADRWEIIWSPRATSLTRVAPCCPGTEPDSHWPPQPVRPRTRIATNRLFGRREGFRWPNVGLVGNRRLDAKAFGLVVAVARHQACSLRIRRRTWTEHNVSDLGSHAVGSPCTPASGAYE